MCVQSCYLCTQVSIQKGYNVILKDTAEQGLGRGYQQVYKGYGSIFRLWIHLSCNCMCFLLVSMIVLESVLWPVLSEIVPCQTWLHNWTIRFAIIHTHTHTHRYTYVHYTTTYFCFSFILYVLNTPSEFNL